MARDFFDPAPEERIIVLIDTPILHKAQQFIGSCEACNEEGAEIPFDSVLDCLTGCSDPSVTEYILEEPATCPSCRRPVLEKTLVEPARWRR